MIRNISFVIYSTVVIAGLLSTIIPSCVPSDPGAPRANFPPETSLGNVPVNDDTGRYIQLIPQQSFFWRGDDPDGFVIAYRWRSVDSSGAGRDSTPWTTILNLTTIAGTSLDTLILVKGTPSSYFKIYNFLATLSREIPADVALRDQIRHSLQTGVAFPVPYRTGLVPGDSLIGADPIIYEAPTKATLIFSSPGERNRHRFEVSAIDNNDAVDPTPASSHFWTLKSPIPRAFLLSNNIVAGSFPLPGGWVLRCPTETSPGLTFRFVASDPSTSELYYSWIVDDTIETATHRWSPWSTEPTALVYAQHFRYLTPDTHKIYVRVKNRWGVLSEPTDSMLVSYASGGSTFYTVRDTFFVATVPPIDTLGHPQRTLIINNNSRADTTAVKLFYTDIMNAIGRAGRFDIYTAASTSNFSFPSREVLSRYTSVIIAYDSQSTSQFGLDGLRIIRGPKQALIAEYLGIGGKLIYSGTQNMPLAVNSPEYIPWDSTWFRGVPYIIGTPRRVVMDSTRSFVGARGRLGYPSYVRLDTNKVPRDSSFALRKICLNYPINFGQAIFTFDSQTDLVGIENQPIGIRYLAGPAPPPCRQSYSTIFLGFPLYYANRDDAVEVLRKALLDLNE